MKTERKNSKPKIAYKISELIEMTGLTREAIEDLVDGAHIECWPAGPKGGARLIPLCELVRLPGWEESLSWIALSTGNMISSDDTPEAIKRELEEMHDRIDRLQERLNRNGLRA